jgi:iron complex outermembrane receptor protein
MRSRGLHIHMSLASVIGLMLCASPAMAQAEAEAASPGDGDIIVTATKRNESLSQVPIAMSVVTDTEIAAKGIVRPQDYLISTPNVTFIDEATGDSFTNIRGQTSVRNSDPNVAVVIDGVQLSSLKQFNQDLFNIEQIEVLKGPQSAIYGRNAAAGAIVVRTKKPRSELGGSVLAGYGSWNTARAQMEVSGPLSDTLGFGIAASFRDTDGPFTNITTGEKPYRLRTALGQARLYWEPTDGLTVDFKVSGHDTTGGSTALQSQFVGLPIGGLPVNELDADRTDLPFVTNVRGELDEWLVAASLKIDYDMGWATITSVTAADKLYQFFGGDSPPYLADSGTPGSTVQGYKYRDRNFSQELRLTSPDDQRLRWQVGLYYLNFTRGQISELNQDLVGVVPPSDGIDPVGDSIIGATVSYARERYKTESFAPFASLQFDITEQLHLNVAGRYDIEKRSVAELAPDAINLATGANYNLCIEARGPGTTLADCQESKTFKQFEPKASISYDLGRTGSVYASYGKGFKSGGFNPLGSRAALLAVAPPGSQVFVQDQFAPEKSTSWEVGTKLRLFDRTLGVNIAAFSTNVSGAQQFEFFPSAGLQTTTSIDKVRLRGFEVDFNWRIPGGPQIFGAYGYTNGKVKAFAANPAYVGNRSPNTNKYNLSGGVTHDFELGGDLTLTPRIEYTRMGSIWWDVANTPGSRRSPVDLVDARLTLAGGGQWSISAFGKNIFNEKYNRSVLPLLGVFQLTSRAETRHLGVEGRFNF